MPFDSGLRGEQGGDAILIDNAAVVISLDDGILDNRRSTSRRPDLLDYVISRPLVSAEMIAHHIGVSTTAARDLIRTFDLHEMTGRQRYPAWSIL